MEEVAKIRELTSDELYIMEDMLYEAIFLNVDGETPEFAISLMVLNLNK